MDIIDGQQLNIPGGPHRFIWLWLDSKLIWPKHGITRSKN